MSFRDFGSRSDPGDQAYAAPADLQVIPTASIAGQFVYQCGQALRDADIMLARAAYTASRANAFGATDEQLEGLKNSARDCQLAIAAAIEALTGEKVETPSRERTIKTLPIDRVGKEVA